MSDLLKEAIADAKAVRETALQNAKMALEEAFTPQLKSMLSAKLKEDEYEDEDEVPVDDEEMGGEEEIPAEEIPTDEIPDEEIPAEEPEGEYGDEEDEEIPEEGLDLEAIIRELEQEIAEEEMYESDNPYDGDEQHEDYSSVTESEEDEVNEEGGKSGSGSQDPAGSGEELKEDEDVDIDESVLDEDEDEDEDKEEVDEEWDKSTGVGKSDNSADLAKSSNIGGNGQEKAVKMESIQTELGQYKEAVAYLKDKLHEVNILNAKLLFTNKLFKEYSLDNNQKLKVVETFDRAQTTREIKLVYSTLAEQFNDNGSIINKKSINESASSKAGSTKPSKGTTKVISEETQVADRFRKLAGLKK